MRTLITIACVIASVSFDPVARAAEHDSGILRAVLVDAHAQLRTSPVPCLADHIKAFGSPEISSVRVSHLFRVRMPFSICPNKLGDRYFRISQAKIVRGYAFVEFDYVCPICGQGTLYTLRQIKGHWSVTHREQTWAS
jgi:hypothetical protein